MKSISTPPILSILKRIVKNVSTFVYDLYYRVNTLRGDGCHQLPLGDSLFQDTQSYASPPWPVLDNMLKSAHIGPDDTFFDLGCGLGRPLFAAAMLRPRLCVGVELDPELCTAARWNVENFRRRRQFASPIEIRQGDAATADYSNGTVFYFYNSFGIRTFRRVLKRITDDLHKHSRPARLVYVNPYPEYLAELKRLGWDHVGDPPRLAFTKQRTMLFRFAG